MLDAENEKLWALRGERAASTQLSVPVSEFESREPQWLIEKLIPLNVPTLLCGDGGCGKSTLTLNIAAAISRGDISFNGLGLNRTLSCGNGVTLILSSEDDPHTVIRPRLNLMQANCNRILIIDDFSTDGPITIGSERLLHELQRIQPQLLIIDPLQAYVPEGTNMNSKSEMRGVMKHLIGYGTKLGITTIIVAHMNKRSGTGGSYRIADSSEIRNAARNVLIIGEAEPGLNYCDHDKCNVSTRSDTILYTYDERRMPQFVRFTDKTDRDFQRQLLQGGNTKKLEIAKDLIISSLMENGSLSGEELELRVVTDEISQHTYQRARASLINSKVIVMHRDCNKHTTYSLITD